MVWDDLVTKSEKIKYAPESGQLLIYTRKSVVFTTYSCLIEIGEMKSIKGQELLEVHLFNDDKEYRAVSTISKQHKGENGIIEHVADFKVNENEEEQDVFPEYIVLDNQYIENGVSEITVYNHLSFNGGLSYVDDYRLKMGGKNNE